MECNFQPLNLTFQVLNTITLSLFLHVALCCVCSVFFYLVSILPSVCVMWFQAINKGPSRLPGSTVDIRIPNRLAGSGADMFHIIETQVNSSSSLSALFIQSKPLFISFFTCKQPHFYFFLCTPRLSDLLIFMIQGFVSTIENTFMYTKLLNRWALCHGTGVRYHWASQNLSTETSQLFCFTTFPFLTKKGNTHTGLKCFLNPCIAPFI